MRKLFAMDGNSKFNLGGDGSASNAGPKVSVHGLPASGVGATSALSTATAFPFVPTSIEMTMLSVMIRRVFKESADHREMSGIDQMLLDAMRASKGEYSPADVAKFRAAGLPDDIYTPLTITKERAALSQLSEMANAGEKGWTLSPSPMPEVPESVAREAFTAMIGELMEIVNATGEVPTPEQAFRYAESRMDEVHRKQLEWAKIRAARMERKVFDQMVEGEFDAAKLVFFKDLVDYGTAAIVGPVPRIKMCRVVKETKVGTYKYVMEPREVLCYEAISPWDLYPAKGARKVTDGFLCIRRRFTNDALWRYASKKPTGSTDEGEWFAGTIDALLARYPEGGCKLDGQPYDLERSLLEKDGPSDANRCIMEGIEFFGDVRGSMLLEIGITKKCDGGEIDPSEFYEVDAIDIGGYIVYCKIIDQRIGRPVSKGVFYADAGSWWGGNIAQRVASAQRVQNAALRNLVNNMAMTSGPMLFVKDVSRLVDKGPDALKIRPWRVLQFNTGGYASNDIPVGTINFESRIVELLKIFDWAKQQADDDSGIPAYTYGMNVTGGALRTSSGLTMMLSEANRVMKMVEVGIDADVIRDLVRRTVAWNMVYSDDVSIKGDCEVNPAGVVGLILRENASQRRKQILNIVLSPAALQILGPKSFVEILRDELEDMQAAGAIRNIDNILPSKERMEQQEMLQQLQQFNAALQGNMGGVVGVQPSAPGGGGEEEVLLDENGNVIGGGGGRFTPHPAQGNMDGGAAANPNAQIGNAGRNQIAFGDSVESRRAAA